VNNHLDTQTAPPAIGQRLPTRRRPRMAHRWAALLGAAVITAAVPALAQAQVVQKSAELWGLTKDASGMAVRAEAYNGGTGVYAESINGVGIYAVGSTALKAVAAAYDKPAIDAKGDDFAIKALSLSGIAVDAVGDDVAVQAMAPNATTGNAKPGTIGVKANADTGVDATGKSSGVKAFSSGGIGVMASGKVRGVQAYADSAGSQGVYAFGDSEGVRADGKIGGNFSGSMAPIRLQPAAAAGAPTTGPHKRGEMVVDSQGNLFLCMADSTSSAPAGTWKKVVLQ
jgi:hypothetical protein